MNKFKKKFGFRKIKLLSLLLLSVISGVCLFCSTSPLLSITDDKHISSLELKQSQDGSFSSDDGVIFLNDQNVNEKESINEENVAQLSSNDGDVIFLDSQNVNEKESISEENAAPLSFYYSEEVVFPFNSNLAKNFDQFFAGNELFFPTCYESISDFINHSFPSIKTYKFDEVIEANNLHKLSQHMDNMDKMINQMLQEMNLYLMEINQFLQN